MVGSAHPTNMALIKANDAPRALAPFSMKDIENQARGMLLRARGQAEELLAAAQKEAEALRKQGKAEGLAEGKAEGLAKGLEEGMKAGREQALAEHKQQLSALVGSLSSGLADFDRSRRELAEAGVRDVLELAIAVAERVTKRQGALDASVAVANVAEALKMVSHASDVRIAINPAQKGTLEEALPKLKLQWPTLKHVEVVADAMVAAGGCRLFTAQGEVDGDIEEQIKRVVSDLLPERQESLL